MKHLVAAQRNVLKKCYDGGGGKVEREVVLALWKGVVVMFNGVTIVSKGKGTERKAKGHCSSAW